MAKNFFEILDLEKPGKCSEIERKNITLWCKTYQNNLNTSKSYKEAAQNWVGACMLAFEKIDKSHLAVYLDIDHSNCKTVDFFEDEKEYETRFNAPTTRLILYAPVKNWLTEIRKEKPDLTKALMKQTIRIKGEMSLVMKFNKASGILGYYFMKTKIEV